MGGGGGGGDDDAEACAEAVANELVALEAMYGEDLEVLADGSAAGGAAVLSLRLLDGAATLEVTLPPGYPTSAPASCSVSARAAPAGAAGRVADALEACAKEALGRECVAELAQLGQDELEAAWPDRGEELVAESAAPSAAAGAAAPPVVALLKFNHLIEGKQHAKEIELVAAAKRLGLIGWVVYGTPGLILGQGPEADIESLLAESRRIGKRGERLWALDGGGGGPSSSPLLLAPDGAALPKKGLAVAAGLATVREALAPLGLDEVSFNKLVLS